MRYAKKVRLKTGLNQRQFAQLVGVASYSTVARWETDNDEHFIEPRGPALSLLKLIEADPAASMTVLSKGKAELRARVRLCLR